MQVLLADADRHLYGPGPAVERLFQDRRQWHQGVLPRSGPLHLYDRRAAALEFDQWRDHRVRRGPLPLAHSWGN